MLRIRNKQISDRGSGPFFIMQEFKSNWEKKTFQYSLDVTSRLDSVKQLLNNALAELVSIEETPPVEHTEKLTTPAGIDMKLALCFRLDKADKQSIEKAKSDITKFLARLDKKPDFYQTEECRVCRG